MDIFSVDFAYGPIGQNRMGWVCRVYFKVDTVNQFTEERHQTHGSSAWWFLAYWRARRAARALYRQLAAKPGERADLGWWER